MALITDILRSYRQPRAVLRTKIAGGPREDRALAYLMLACFLVFIAQWPRLARIAQIEERDLQPLLGGALLGWVFIAPLFFYLLAIAVRLIARLLGGKGTAFEQRMGLFWTLVVVSPLWLLHGLTAGMIGPGSALTLVGVVTAFAFVVIWAVSIVEVETFKGQPA